MSGFLLLVVFLLLLIIVIFLCSSLSSFTLGLFLFFFSLFSVIKHLLFGILHWSEGFFKEGVSFFLAIRYDEVIEDGSRLNLPEIKGNSPKILVVVDSIVIRVIRVCNHWVNPRTLVIRVLNALCLPLSLVLRVINHGSFIFTIRLIIPIFRFLCFWIHDLSWNVVISFRLFVLRIVHHFIINPVFRLALVGILDLLRRKEVPIFLEASRGFLLAVNLDNIGVVRLDDKSVHVGQLVILTLDILIDKMLFALVGENHVNLLGAVSTDVRTEHDSVLFLGFLIECSSVKALWEDFHVSTSAVNLLCMFDRELDYKGLVGVVKDFIEVGCESVELGVLAGHQTLIFLFISIPVARGELPLTIEFVHGALYPLVHGIEGVLKVSRP
mmetsp:Transcript_25850/g.62266  ORF Transcript_25850/g.62266 Transcript_25850/m.62266 type:complete len:383 (+) Transcript_25850:82-1230(+)